MWICPKIRLQKLAAGNTFWRAQTGRFHGMINVLDFAPLGRVFLGGGSAATAHRATMKVLGLCSGRKNGNTEIMMKEIFKTIEADCGAECRLVRIQEAEIRNCTGCETCMINHLKGNLDFRCIHKSDSDHFYFIEQLMREADAIIVSSPAYNLMPVGALIRFLNKLHASGDYRDLVQRRQGKIGAAFSLGGTDWTNFTLDMCNMIAMELAGSYENVVDLAHFDFVPSVGAVVLEPQIMDRMVQMGHTVAKALQAREKGEKIAYEGNRGLCPDCHGIKIEKRDDGWYCPQCLTKATLSMENGELKVDFTPEEMAKNRWSPWGQELHNNNIMKGHKKAGMGKETIDQKRKEYGELDYAVQLPVIEK